MVQRRKGPRSRTRLQDREVEKKVVPAIKVLSQHMHNTDPRAEEKTLIGYKIPAGDFVDSYGIHWQSRFMRLKQRVRSSKLTESSQS